MAYYEEKELRLVRAGAFFPLLSYQLITTLVGDDN